jgi:dihydrofolate reductase
MRKLKLQMQVTVDGCVAGPDGQLDWMTWEWDPELEAFTNRLHDTVDTILLGRKMTDGFIKHWEQAALKPGSKEYEFAQRMVNTPKVVFSKTVKHVDGKNVRVENGDLVGAVEQLKSAAGKDIIVYGGAGFVSSLIEHGLIDEMNFFVNPVAIGSGMRVFKGKRPLALAASKGYPCGVVVNIYLPK